MRAAFGTATVTLLWTIVTALAIGTAWGAWRVFEQGYLHSGMLLLAAIKFCDTIDRALLIGLPLFGLLAITTFAGRLLLHRRISAAYAGKDNVPAAGRSLAALVAVVALAAALHAGVGMAASIKGEGKYDMVLIDISGLRPDHMGTYGYSYDTTPSIDKLAQSSLVFGRAYAASPLGIASNVSILTGLLPSDHGMWNRVEHLERNILTLPEVLTEEGYSTVLIFSDSGGRNIHNDLLEDFDDVVFLHGRDARGVTDEVFHALNRMRTRPLFLYVVYEDLLFPVEPPDDSAAEFCPDLDLYGNREWHSAEEFVAAANLMDEREKAHQGAMYDAALKHVDAEIGRLIDELAYRDYLDFTAVAIVADRGVEFSERWTFGIASTLWDESIRVPLIISLPGNAEGGFIVQPVSVLDLASTLASLAGTTWPTGGDDLSIYPLASDEQLQAVPFEVPDDEGVVRGLYYNGIKYFPAHRVRFGGMTYDVPESLLMPSADHAEVENLAQKPGGREMIESFSAGLGGKLENR